MKPKRYVAAGGHKADTIDVYVSRNFGSRVANNHYNAPYVSGNCLKRYSEEHTKIRAFRIALMVMYFVLLEK